MSNIIIALGGNIGDVQKNFDKACSMINQSCHIVIKSKLYQTPALIDQGAAPQHDYLNAAIHVVSTLPPADILAELHHIEATLGRKRKKHWGSRNIDLDLIDYEGCISTGSTLTLPHPELGNRLFVLQPIHDIVPNWTHPITGLCVSNMIATLQQKGEVLVKGDVW